MTWLTWLAVYLAIGTVLGEVGVRGNKLTKGGYAAAVFLWLPVVIIVLWGRLPR